MELLRDRSAEFEAAGVQAAGISRDSPWTHIAWMQALDLTFPLLSDWNAEAVHAFGAAHEFRGFADIAERTASAFQSERSVKFRSSACIQAMCVQGESRETPKRCTPASSNSALLSRRSSISFVQVDDQSKR